VIRTLKEGSVAIDCGRILIVDGDAGFRAFVARLLERAGFATNEVATGGEALAAASDGVAPGLVLLDLSLSDISGFEVCRELRDKFGEDLPIVFVSGERTDPLDRAAGLLVGADDYLTKPVHPDELLARVRRLVSRSRQVHPVVAGATRDVDFTPREQEVLLLLAEGLHPKEIALELAVRPKTVASHIQRIIGKFGVHSRAEAVAVAYRDGFVQPLDAFDPDAEVEAHSSGKPSLRRKGIAVPMSLVLAR
jgi:DNA-binding NarL/FixJ family response regulator